MKKVIFIIILFVCNSCLFAQSKAQNIFAQQEHINSLKKYDNFYDSAYSYIQNCINIGNISEKALWHSYMALFLENFYDENIYKILSISKIENTNILEKSLHEWDIQTIVEQIVMHYELSLKDKDSLVQIPYEQYQKLFTHLDSFSIMYYSSLYEALACLAIQFYNQTIDEMPIPIRPFDINDTCFFSDNQIFAKISINTSDTLSFSYQALKIIQTLTSFYQEQSSELQIYIALLRLNYLQTKCTLSNKKGLYYNALNNLENNYQNQKGYEQICYVLGDYYQKRGEKYDTINFPEYYNDYKIAIEWYEKAIEFAPNSYSAINAKNKIQEIKKSSITATLSETYIPNQIGLMSFVSTNCDSIYIQLFAVDESTFEEMKTTSPIKFLKKLSVSKAFTICAHNKYDYRPKTFDAIFPAMESGHYIMWYSNRPFSEIQDTMKIGNTYAIIKILVNNIDFVYNSKNADLIYYVFDRQTGYPLENATIKIEMQKNKSIQLKRTDKNGYAYFNNILKYSRIGTIHVSYKNEKFSFDDYFYSNYNDKTSSFQKVYFFTDRQIYRPGQQVYFKGIAVKSDSNHSVLSNVNYQIMLYDANYQAIDSIKVTTNQYGSFSGNFTLPSTSNTGTFSLGIVNSKGYYERTYFSVEEYKRPNFEVKINQPKDCFKLDQSITIKGECTAYSGYAIDNAKVTYHVVRHSKFPYCRWWNNMTTKEIVQGETTTNDNGEFELTFIAESSIEDRNYFPVYQYIIFADVTDISGETHSCSTAVYVGSKSLYIHLDIPENNDIHQSKQSFSLQTTNLSGENQNTLVHYSIERLEVPSIYYHSRDMFPIPDVENFTEKEYRKNFPYLSYKDNHLPENWKGNKILEGSLFTNDTSFLDLRKIFNKKHLGYYRITLTAKDTFNQEVTHQHIFSLNDAESNNCTRYEPIFLDVDKTTIYIGDTLHIVYGSYLEDVVIHFEFTCNDSIIYQEHKMINKGQIHFDFPIKKEHLGYLHCNIFVHHHNHFYNQTKKISVQETNKNIYFEYVTFRNYLQPGEKEQWHFKIKNAEGKPIVAELLCNMYDASLDAFVKHNYNFSLPIIDGFHYTYFDYKDFNHETIRSRFFEKNHNPLINILSPQWINIPYNIGFESEICYMVVAKNNVSTRNAKKIEMDDDVDVLSIVSVKEEAFVKEEASITKSVLPNLRSNFNETAFFYPHLQSDSNGNIIFSATMPESLTKWKMHGIAHNQNLYYGLFEQFIQTQKDLMLVVNYPRFLREGDTIVFTAKVVNMSAKKIAGHVSLQISNSVDDKPLDIIYQVNKDTFNLSKGESDIVSFTLIIPHEVGAINCKTMAISDIHSDGEQKILPILSNRMLVTETMPIYVNKGQTKTFTFDKFKQAYKHLTDSNNTLSNYKYTFEFTANPLWYALQSLPYLIEYPYECYEQIFSRLYANTIASTIVNFSPEIKAVFMQWQQEDSNAFLSNLEKNSELKNIAIENSPWLLEAQSEKENKQRISNLFDTKRINLELNKAQKALEKGQRNDGGWSWFSGGYRSNFFITSHIVSGCGHLQTMNISENLNANTLRKAIQFIDNSMQKWYDSLKNRSISDNFLSYNVTQYLYARSFFFEQFPIAEKNKKMFDFCINQAQKYWTEKNLYGQTLIALSLYRSGDKITAEKIITSIKSKAQYSDEMGMWWHKEGLGWYWYEAPIERQALMIEAFETISKDSESVAKMQLWLLKQRQSQNWGSTKSTTAACYALLLRGNNNLSKLHKTKITIGEQIIYSDTISSIESGTGYFKMSWNNDEITPDMGNISLQQIDNGTSWGSCFWQYFENLDKISSAKTSLAINKQLYKITFNDRGEQLSEIKNNTTIAVGDKIKVRIVISTDRDMEYVHLKDMRASCFEPTNILSGYRYQGGLMYYESTRDVATNFFIEYLPKGTYVFEYTLIATQKGQFSNGITTIQCMYAPEFTSHSEGIRINVK